MSRNLSSKGTAMASATAVVSGLRKLENQRKFISWTAALLFVGATLFLVLFNLFYFDPFIAATYTGIQDTITNKKANTYIYFAVGAVAAIASVITVVYYMVNIKNGVMTKTERLPLSILILGLSTYTMYLFFRGIHRLCFTLRVVPHEVWATRGFYLFVIVLMSRMLRPLAMHTVTVLSLRIVAIYAGYPVLFPRPRWVGCSKSASDILKKRRTLYLSIFALCSPSLILFLYNVVLMFQSATVEEFIADESSVVPMMAIDISSAVFDLWTSMSLFCIRSRLKQLDLDQSSYLVPLSFMWFVYIVILYANAWTVLTFYGAIVKWVLFAVEVSLASLFLGYAWSTMLSMKHLSAGVTRPNLSRKSTTKSQTAQFPGSASVISPSASRDFEDGAGGKCSQKQQKKPAGGMVGGGIPLADTVTLV